MKNIRFVLSENFQFLEVKFSVYLNRHVFVMRTFNEIRLCLYNVCRRTTFPTRLLPAKTLNRLCMLNGALLMSNHNIHCSKLLTGQTLEIFTQGKGMISK